MHTQQQWRHIKASAGMDIGDTLIGMHLRDVAVPVRISHEADEAVPMWYARGPEPRFIGGVQAIYDENRL